MFTLWRSLTPDGRLLFAARSLRLFAYGFLAVVLALYLASLGLSDADVGLLLSLTLLGDTVISLWITTTADRWGRRRMLLTGANASRSACKTATVHRTSPAGSGRAAARQRRSGSGRSRVVGHRVIS